MNKIEFKDFAKHCFIDSIKTAKYQADTAARNCNDNGSCNFDACLIRVEKILTAKEFIQMFADCGVTVEKYLTVLHWRRGKTRTAGIQNVSRSRRFFVN